MCGCLVNGKSLLIRKRLLMHISPGEITLVPLGPLTNVAMAADLSASTYEFDVVGAGSTSLLEGRGVFASARDAWEYALAVTGWGAALYRFSPQGPPSFVARLPVSADLKSGELRVTVASEQLRGNPSRWGYIVAAMALDPRTADGNPPKPLEGASAGNSILGILAPLEQQKSLGAAAEGGRRRLAAVRAR